MAIPLSALIVEDNEDDVLLLLEEIRRSGYHPSFERVQTADRLLEALARQQWDIVLTDYTLPHFSGEQALDLVQRHDRDLPVVMVSGTVPVDRAIALMRSGLRDIVWKNELTRLGPVIARETQEAAVHRAYQQSQQALATSETALRTIFNSVYDAIFLHTREGTIADVNDQMLAMYGVTREEARRMSIAEDFSAASCPVERLPEIWQQAWAGRPQFFAWRARRPHDGTEFDVEVFLRRIALPSGDVVMANVRDVTGRKRTEAELQRSQFLLRQVLGAAPQFIVLVDEELHILLANQAVSEFYRLPLDQLVGRTQFELHRELGMSQDDVAEWAADNRRALENGPVARFDQRRNRAGVEHWYRTRRIPLNLADGKRGVLVVSEDISELKATEDQLQRRNRALRLLSDINQALIHAETEEELVHRVCETAVEAGEYRMAWVGYLQPGPEKRVQPVAHAGEEEAYVERVRFSWAEDTPSGQGPLGQAIRSRQVVYAEDLRTAEHFGPWRDEALRRGYSSVIVLPLVIGDEMLGAMTLYRQHPYSFSVDERTLLRELADDLAFGINALRTREARQGAERALARERTFLSTALELLPFPVFFLHPEGGSFRENQAARELVSHIGPSDERFATPFDVLDPVTRAVLPHEQWPEARALQGEIVRSEEYILHFRDGYEVPVLAQAAPIREGDRVTAVVVAVQDITPVKEADSAKTRFLAILSHEMRTPLTSILGWAREAEDLPELVPQALPIIIRNAESQRRLLDTLLEISRLLYGRFTILHAPVDVRLVLEQAVAELRTSAGEQRIRTTWPSPGTPSRIIGDARRLHEALSTLMEVALELNTTEDPIAVQMTADPRQVTIRVSAAGRRIPAEELPRLLELFQVAPETVQIGGIGVRLALVRAIIEAHGGDISINTEDGAQGNVFTIALPLSPQGA